MMSGCATSNAVYPSQEVVSEAADMGITYGLEVVNRYETNILNTAVQVPLCHPPAVCDGCLLLCC